MCGQQQRRERAGGWDGEFADGIEQRADAGVVVLNLALQLA